MPLEPVKPPFVRMENSSTGAEAVAHLDAYRFIWYNKGWRSPLDDPNFDGPGPLDDEKPRWRGESAYEIAIRNGFVGTEAEWLASLGGGGGGGVPPTRTINDKPLSADIILTAEDVEADPEGTAVNLLNQAPQYVEGDGIDIEELNPQLRRISTAAIPLAAGSGIVISDGVIRTNVLGSATFSTPGDHAVTPPAGATAYYIEMLGGGGGGGGGRRGAADTTRGGGGGGQAGYFQTGVFYINYLSPGFTVRVGAGGTAGAAAAADNADGGIGGDGGTTLVAGNTAHPILRAFGGKGGGGGTSTAGGFGGGLVELATLLTYAPGEGVVGYEGAGEVAAGVAFLGFNVLTGGRLGALTNMSMKQYVSRTGIVGPAGGGGGINAANALQAPSAGDVVGAQRVPLYNPGSAGTPTTKNAAAPTLHNFPPLVENSFGVGGSGGAASADSVAGNGSAGSPRGGGGGGGGASLNGFASGAGGAGGAGFVRIVWL